MGIAVGGVDIHDKITGFYWWEDITTPEDALERAIKKAIEFGSLTVGVETDQGGDTWKSVYREACRSLIEDGTYESDQKFPTFKSEKAGAGHGPKVERASRQLADYERGRIVHVIGPHAVLEKALRRFPVREPHDLTDASYWSWKDLRGNVLGPALARAMKGSPESHLRTRLAERRQERERLAAQKRGAWR